MGRLFNINSKWPLPLKPSEYVRRQIHVQFADDPTAVAARNITGLTTIIWGNDYPHAEGTFREPAVHRGELRGVPDDEKAAILGGTLAGIVGFDKSEEGGPSARRADVPIEYERSVVSGRCAGRRRRTDRAPAKRRQDRPVGMSISTVSIDRSPKAPELRLQRRVVDGLLHHPHDRAGGIAPASLHLALIDESPAANQSGSLPGDASVGPLDDRLGHCVRSVAPRGEPVGMAAGPASATTSSVTRRTCSPSYDASVCGPQPAHQLDVLAHDLAGVARKGRPVVPELLAVPTEDRLRG